MENMVAPDLQRTLPSGAQNCKIGEKKPCNISIHETQINKGKKTTAYWSAFPQN
jgi:hypothetical protein